MVDLIAKILKVFDDHGLFNEGVELIGSWCFQLYQKHLGVRKFPLITPDIDFLVPQPFRGKAHPDFLNSLQALGFQISFNSDESLYLWNGDLKIEFMAPEKGRGVTRAVHIKALGLRAIPLRFVSFLLKDPIVIREGGMKILVPNPACFSLHKLLVASRRKKAAKSLKDLQQAVETSVIVSSQELRRVSATLPRQWLLVMTKTLDIAMKEFPFLEDAIQRFSLVLQSARE